MDEIERRAGGDAAPSGEAAAPRRSEPRGVMELVAGGRRARAVAVAVLVVLALLSAFPARARFSDPETYRATIATLDEKKANVMALTGAAAAASAGLSAIPGDAGTPIAEKLIDIAGDFALVLGVIYLEKYLLTIFGLAAFGLLFPLACALLAAAVLSYGRLRASGALSRLAAKLAVFGASLLLLVPTSVAVTDMVDQTYQVSSEAAAAADRAADDAAEEGDGDAPSGPLEFLQQIPGMVADGLESVSDEVLDQLNSLIEQFAVMVVTSCAIPLLVLVLFLWLAKTVLGADVDAPMGALRARADRLAAPVRRPGGPRGGDGA